MKNSKIYIVEDESIIARFLKSDLEELGYIVTGISASGEDAIRIISETNTDLVLMDITLQGQMNGIEAAAVIKSRFNIPIIYLTANDDLSLLKEVTLTEPYGYILKPYSDPELLMTIDIALYKHKIENILNIHNDIMNIHNERLMRYCFLVGTNVCPKKINENLKNVFVIMPFKKPYEDEYIFGIQEPLKELGFSVLKGGSQYFNYGLCCDLCSSIQSSKNIICNISEKNDNVFFELGLSYGLGKNVINIKNTTVTGDIALPEPPSNIKGLYYERYSSIDELRKKIVNIFSNFSIKQEIN